jgi:hypothetical protein
MKISKSLLAVLAIGGFAAAASAQTDIYLAGSTAYRAPVTKAIQDVLGANNVAWDGGSAVNPLYKAGEAIISGTYSGNWVIVHTYWTGSVAGLDDLSVPNALTNKFIGDAVVETGGAAVTSGSNGINIHGTGYATVSSAYVQIAMSDSFPDTVGKSISAISAGKTVQADITTLLTNNDIKEAGTSAGANGGPVGIVPFIWCSGSTATAVPFTNITQQAAAELNEYGATPVETLESGTAVTSDTNDYAFLVGRNEDSGTRVAAEAEARIGADHSTSSYGQGVSQYYVTFTGSPSSDGTFSSNPADGITAGTPIQAGGATVSVSDIGLWPSNSPLNTETTLNWNIEGHSGQISGGDVAGVLEALNPQDLPLDTIDNGDGQPGNWVQGTSNAYLVAYLAASDAASLATSQFLSYNGVPYSAANIDNGAYTFWSFEHMLYVTTGANAISGVTLNFAKALGDEVYNFDAQTNSSGVTTTASNPPVSSKVAGLYLFNANFTKSREGDTVTPNF